MERDYALRHALEQNSKETQRWETYKKENEATIQNLQDFSKHLTVEVMVPVGKKAFMPGLLIHTNEVLVGHFQGYFSKCSAYKATEICQLRLNQAKEHLKNLEIEGQLWQNKLEKPYMEGVLPSANEREIIEDYDEEKEKLWRKEHKLMVKRAKMKEKEERVAMSKKTSTVEKVNNDNDIFKMLEEAELLEELEYELEKLEVDELSDETIRQLMAGEMELSKEKTRTAHQTKVQLAETKISERLNGVFKKTEVQKSNEKSTATNNNTLTNPEILIDDINDEDDLTEEVNLIKDQAKFLPASDQVGFYEYQIEIIRKKIANVRLTKESDIEEKLHLLRVQSELEDLLAIAEEEWENEFENESNVDLNEVIAENETKNSEPNSNMQKRRIAFALEDETLLFRDTETVSQMLPKLVAKTTEQRDVITLDNDAILNDLTKKNEFQTQRDKTQSIIEKVEKNLQFVTENQSKVNYDLVTKIIDESKMTTARTIFIKFKHSEQQGPMSNDNSLEENIIPGKPSDFYNIYLKQQQNYATQSTIYVNSYIGEECVKAPILKEANRELAYEDPRAKYSDPKKSNDNAEILISKKSILRNKSAVEREFHFANPVTSKKQTKKKPTFDEDEYMSAYWKVMNDVVEKPLTEPEPLPKENFIDAHTPKKRISRFKQMRTEVERT